MSKRTWLQAIVLVTLLGLAATGLSPVRAGLPTPVIHENPASLTEQQPFDVNGKLMLQLEQMFGSLNSAVLHINARDFEASRLSMKDFELKYALFRDYLGRMNLTGTEYQHILDQANLTASDLRAVINSSEAFEAGMASFERYQAQGDTLNATIMAAELQKYIDEMNRTSQQLTARASAIGGLLRNTSVSTDHLDRGIDMLNVYMERMSERNALPVSLLGDTNLTLDASLDSVSAGDTVAFYVRLSSNGTAIDRGLISLHIDGEPAAGATTGADGTCIIYHFIRGGTFNGTINAVAYYDPQGASYAPAVSNSVLLTRRPITPDLTVSLHPGTARFGDTVRLQGRLEADGGYPVPDRHVSICFPGLPAFLARTSGDGSYSCDVRITPEVPAGALDIFAAYRAGNATGDALVDAASPHTRLNVIQEASTLTLDRPPSALTGGESVRFAGALRSAGGLPVKGQQVSIYAGNVCLGSNYTDEAGQYSLSITVPFGITAGTYQVYAAYSPPDGMSLAGSRSSEYEVTFAAAPPVLVVYGRPIVAFQGDNLDLLVNVTANGVPVDECDITVDMSGLALGRGRTDVTGNYYLASPINGSAGLQAIKAYSAAHGLLEAASVDAGTVIIMPFDLATSLGIAVIILAALGLVIARAARPWRVLSRLKPARKKPLPKPTIEMAPLYRPPEEHGIRREQAGLEGEIARIEAIVAGGADYQAVIMEIYKAARRISGARGFDVLESDTHREFYRKIVAREPGLDAAVGTITRHYESAVFGHKRLSEKDIVGSLSCLKEIDTIVGRPEGDGA